MYSTHALLLLNKDTQQKPGWYQLSLDRDFCDYYNRLFFYATRRRWNSCMNGPHITFITGEKDDRIVTPSEMKKYEMQSYTVTYDGIVQTDNRSFWINCECAMLDEVRISLGLSVPKKFGYHITLGNMKK